jgi:predicted dinucleotide-binding enzyme
MAVLAVAGAAAEDLARSVAEPLTAKVLIDATNPLDFSTGAPRLFVGHDDSLGERVQRAAPRSRVVKAYNVVGNTLMVDPQLPGGPPTMLIGGNDEGAKSTVSQLLHDTGWEVADLGGIEASRYLEPLAMAWVLYGMGSGGWEHAFRMLHK